MSTARKRRLVVAFVWLMLVGLYVVNLALGENAWPGVQPEIQLILKLAAVVFLPVTGFLLWPQVYEQDLEDEDDLSDESSGK